MKIYKIEVNGISIYGIISFYYKKEANNHSRASIYAHITDDMMENCIRHSCIDEWATIIGKSRDDDEQVLFAGVVKNFSVNQESNQKTVKIDLISGSYLMDLTQNIYVHQDTNEIYTDLVEEILGKYPKPFCQYRKDASKGIGSVFVQYEESDWEFVNRMAANLHMSVIPKTNYEGVSFDFGLDEDREQKELSVFTEKTVGKRNSQTFYQVKTIEYYDIGTPILFQGMQLYIYSASGSFDTGVLENVYELRTKEGFSREPYQNDRIIGASITAHTENVSGDKLLISTGCETKHACTWFPFATIYSSPDGSGWYCMPEKGDQMRLYFPTNREKEAYVISAVHLPVEEQKQENGQMGGSAGGNSEPPRSNPDYKSIKNKQGKEIVFKPDSILITNNNGMYIELNDNEGISIVSDKKISMETSSSLSLVSAYEGISVVANSEISLAQRNTIVQLKDDVTITGGKIKTVG